MTLKKQTSPESPPAALTLSELAGLRSDLGLGSAALLPESAVIQSAPTAVSLAALETASPAVSNPGKFALVGAAAPFLRYFSDGVSWSLQGALAASQVITVPAPAAVGVGDLVIVGEIVGVARTAASAGAPVELRQHGVFTLPALGTDAWVTGASLYWDATNKRLTTSWSGNRRVGAAASTKLASVVSGDVRILGGGTLPAAASAAAQAAVSDLSAAPAAIDASNAAALNGAMLFVGAGATLTIDAAAWAALTAGVCLTVAQGGSATLAWSGGALKENASGASAVMLTLVASGMYAVTKSPSGSPRFRVSGGASL